MRPFDPFPTSTVSISASGASQRVAFDSRGTRTQVRVYNAGSATVFIEFGDSTVTAATTSGMPIPAGAVEVLSISGDAAPYVAVISTGVTGTIYFTPGDGY